MTEPNTGERASSLASEALEIHRTFVQRGLERRGPIPRALEEPGVLVAEGDSWFDYPGSNVLESLEWHYGYDVWSVAHNGDTLEEIVYDPRQLAKLVSKLEKIKRKGKKPRAILVSGGGNDIAGSELAVLLNHQLSGLDTVNADIVNGVIDVRLDTAWRTYIDTIRDICRQIFDRAFPIFTHGYDNPVPDGRGFLGGMWVLPGPWLRPAFRRKGYPADPDDLAHEKDVMADLIRRYNDMLLGLDADFDDFHYVPIVGTLSSDAGDYKDDWRDELHPTDEGFGQVAELFHRAITGI